MMENNFLQSGDFSENGFTDRLASIMKQFPETGRNFINALLQDSGKEYSGYYEVDSQPFLSLEDRPDLLIRCNDFDIICEHKLSSDLGDRQLERYLELAQGLPKKTYLALISNRSHDISEAVLNSEYYLTPPGKTHFRWHDLYPIFDSQEEAAIQNFARLMNRLGMKRSLAIEGWADLFDNSQKTKLFQQQWEAARFYFRSLGARCSSVGGDDYALQISYPLPWLHLIYFYIERKGVDDTLPIEPPYLRAVIWLPETAPCFNLFSHIQGQFLERNDRPIWVRGGKVQRVLKNTDGTIARWVADYTIDLSHILFTDLSKTQNALLEFSTTVFEDVKNRVVSFV